jgi:hypothetical protein
MHFRGLQGGSQAPFCKVSSLSASLLRASAKLVEILDVRAGRAVEPLHLRIRRLNHIILVRRMRSAAVTKTEMAGWQPERIEFRHCSVRQDCLPSRPGVPADHTFNVDRRREVETDGRQPSNHGPNVDLDERPVEEKWQAIPKGIAVFFSTNRRRKISDEMEV